ncbi:MAG: type VI secretion system protein TssA [Desulfobacteraceae bacterium]|nr:type VI secretion system protein TssA [Desulfobacteraceae bacterium]
MDLEAILAPIPGENPCGESLRYTPVYDEIQEARKADDLLDQGEWQHEVKTADWPRAMELSLEALSTKSKDLQIAAWLMEALTHLKGFDGVMFGFQVFNGLFEKFWEPLYPEIDEGDLDYRVGPLEFLNDKLWLPIKQIPLTDPSASRGFTFMQWQESKLMGSEKETMSDDKRRAARQEMIDDGKVSPEEFESGIRASSRAYYETLVQTVTQCQEEFNLFDTAVDDKFGREAPRLAEIKESIEECLRLVTTIVKEKRELEPDPEPVAVAEAETAPAGETTGAVPDQARATLPPGVAPMPPPAPVQAQAQAGGQVFQVNRLMGGGGIEEALWRNATATLAQQGIKPALEQLLGASCSAQSVRERTNFRLLMARLCLEADRPDLARPIVEELTTLVEELQLERWESPIWIAEALGTLYQCLMARGSTDDDHYRASELLTRLCTLDVTKAMEFSMEGPATE